MNGTLNLLAAAVACGVRRFVFASSIALYGPGGIVFAEDTPPIGPVSLYGQTKQLGEALCARFLALHGLDYVALRYGGVFGPGGEVRGSGMSGLRHLLKQTMGGRDVTLDGASGDECFQYVYVKDAAEATIQAMDRQNLAYRSYNIAGPLENYVSLKEFHAAIRRAVPEAGSVEFTGKSHSGLRVSIDRIRDNMGFEPRLSVEEGLRDEFARGRA
ncbi:MAG: NAD(P)-dependent oxidoreductase [Rhodospirillaceae bacterium]|nr:NAD(P)-dependent oxidoreductase [Rhodospirillaceae bacterium]